MPLLKAYDQACEDDDLFAVGVMSAHGVDTGIANELHALTQGAHVWAADLRGEATGLEDGEVIEFGSRAWRAWHRPGHSPSDMVFHDERTGELIGGDHLLAKVSSNPIVHKPLDGSGARPRSLMTYIDSLNETRAMDVSTVHGGHGGPVGDHVALIDERLRLHDRRARKIERALYEGQAVSAHEIARGLWGDIAVKEAYLTLSETLGHLDLLVADGRAVEDDSGDTILYSAP